MNILAILPRDEVDRGKLLSASLVCLTCLQRPPPFQTPAAL